jgi:hypothetical protein
MSYRDERFKVWVGFLPPAATPQSLGAFMTRFGTVEDVFINSEKQYAFVTYSDPAAVQRALASSPEEHVFMRENIIFRPKTQSAGSAMNRSGPAVVPIRTPYREMPAPGPYAGAPAPTVPRVVAPDVERMVCDLSPQNVYDLLAGLKQMAATDPTGAEMLLSHCPQLSQATLVAMAVLGMAEPNQILSQTRSVK